MPSFSLFPRVRNSVGAWLGGSSPVLGYCSSMSAGALASEGLAGAGGPTSKRAHSHGWQVGAG